MNRFSLRNLGPGLLLAATAIGVSHLVQSTRAGAGWGLALTWVILLANLFKYPFFEFGSRYVAGTGESLIEGYRRQGRWVLWLYILITISVMFIVEAAVTIVTGSLFARVFGLGMNTATWSGILLGVCAIVLVVGRFRVLDGIIKVVIVALTLSTALALTLALVNGGASRLSCTQDLDIFRPELLLFAVALMGWMPSSLDIPVWQSVWVLEERKQGKMRDAQSVMTDFNIGYIGTAVIALMFMLLGALVMYGTGEELSAGGIQFAGQFINMYVSTLGEWSFALIAIAALTTMTSTTLAVLDAFPRVLGMALESGLRMRLDDRASRRLRQILMILLAVGCYLIIAYMTGNLRLLVDFATTVSFVVAPVLAIFNYRAVTAPHMPPAMRPRPWLRLLAAVGWAFLTVFTVLFLWTKLS